MNSEEVSEESLLIKQPGTATSAGKPEPPEWLFRNIEVASSHAKHLFALYVALLAYGAITIAGVTDKEVALNSPVRLPILNVEILLIGFAALYPAIAMIVFSVLMLYMFRLRGLRYQLWRDYSCALRRRLYPWLANIADDPEPGLIGMFQKGIVIFCLWWCLPLALTFHSLAIIRLHLLWLSTATICCSYFSTVVIVVLLWPSYYFGPAEEEVIPRRVQNARNISRIITLCAFSLIILIIIILISGSGSLARGVWPWSWIAPTILGLSLGAMLPRIASMTSYQPSRVDPDYSGFPNIGAAVLFGGVYFAMNTIFLSSIVPLAQAGWPYDTNNPNWFDSHVRQFFVLDLRNQNLVSEPRVDYEGVYWADLRGVHLEGADLTSAVLRKADLRSAKLNGARLFHTNLSRCNLTGAEMSHAFAQFANLDSAILTGVTAIGSDFSVARFTRADLTWSANFDSCNFMMSMLPNADLTNSSFNHCNFQDAKMLNARLGATHVSNTTFIAARMRNTDMIFLKGDSVVFAYCDLSGARVMAADLQNANFYWARLDSATFGGSNLNNVNFNIGVLNRTDLSDCSLEYATFEGSYIVHADLRNSKSLTVSQLCEAGSLYDSRFDSLLLDTVSSSCPSLLQALPDAIPEYVIQAGRKLSEDSLLRLPIR